MGNKQGTTRGIARGSAVALAMALSGCFGLGKRDNAVSEAKYLATNAVAPVGASLERAQAAFSVSLQPLAARHCGACHGAGQQPLFAVTDSRAAASLAWTRVQFAAPDRSALVARSKDGHCGTAACRTDGSLFSAAIEDWGLRYEDQTRAPDAPPGIELAAEVRSTSEAGGAVILKVTSLLGGPNGIDVNYRITGTATAGEDYSLPAGGMVRLAPYQKSADIRVALVDDSLSEGDETLLVQLESPVRGSLVSGRDRATITLSDNESAATVQFEASTSSAAESTGTRSIAATLSRASSVAVTVPVQLTGTAASADYTASAGSLTFAPGATRATLEIAIADDALDEDAESVVINLGQPTGGAVLGAPASHTLTISDDDAAPSVVFAAASQSVSESVGTVTVALSLSAASSRTVTVPFTVSGTAQRPSDHNLAAGTVTFPAGSAAGSVSISIVSDQVSEQDETVVITLGAPTNATLGNRSTFTLTIQQSVSGTPQASFQAASQRVQESAGNVSVVVTLDRVATTAVTVPFVVSGTAGAADRTLANSNVTVAAGASQATLTFPITSDTLDEDDETVVITLGSSASVGVGAVGVHTVTVADDDSPPTVSFASATSSAAEGAGTVSLSVRLSAASSKSITVAVSATGTAQATADYSLGSTTLTFGPGSTTANASVAVVGDSVDENDETVVVALGSPTNATLGTPVQATLTIVDDDAAPSASFSVASQVVQENQGPARVTVRLSAASAKSVTLPYTVGGSAQASADYSFAAGNLMIAAGATSLQFDVPLVDDSAVEPSDESIVLTLGSPINATLGTPAAHTISIGNDDTTASPGVEAFRTSVYVITRRDCASCHATDVTPFHASSDLSQAYGAAKTVVAFATPEASRLVAKSKDGHCGNNATCRTDGSAMLAAIRLWAQAEGGTGNPEPDPGNGGVLETANSRIRSANRVYVKDMLDEIFGSTATAVTTSLVANQRKNFGAPCDHYATPLRDDVPSGDCSEGDVRDGIRNLGDSQLPIPGPNLSSRFALTSRACDKIVSADAAVLRAAGLAMGSSTTPSSLSSVPTGAQIEAAFELFYPGRVSPAAVTTGLTGVVQASTAAGYPAIEAWRYLFRSLCISPDWQYP